MKIRIMTDSTCDLNPEYLRQHDVTVIPLTVTLNGRDYVDDGVSLTPEDIFRAVGNGSDLPKTSAVNTASYRETFKEGLKSCDAIIHFAIGAEFSSCHVNAVAAAKGLPVYCVDTRNLSSGMGLIVAEAVDMVEAGCESPEAIVGHIQGMLDKVDCSFVLNRLDYLHKGGRCSMVAMLGANMLHLKPCIEVQNGKMVVGRKYRGSYERCVKQYIEDRLHNADTVNPKRAILVHTGIQPEAVANVRAVIENTFHFGELMETRAGSTISSHCGDTTLGLMFVRK